MLHKAGLLRFPARACILFLVFTSLLVAYQPEGPSFSGIDKVDPRVLVEAGSGQAVRYLVLLKGQADLKMDEQISPRADRAVDAYRRLSQFSTAHQAGIIQFLEQSRKISEQPLAYQAFWLVNSLVVTSTRPTLAALAGRDDVEKIVPDDPFLAPEGEKSSPAAPTSTIEWNIQKVGAPAVWARGFTGQGIVYANADTGVQWDHPALIKQYRGWNPATGKADHNYSWWDAVKQSILGSTNTCGINIQAPCDDYNHGTHTMGIGVGYDGSGDHIGMAPGARWIACRNMDNGVGRPSTYIDCLEFLIAPTDLQGNNPRPDLHADVISNSYACPSSELCTDTSLHQAVENVRAAGIFMAVSVGNGRCTSEAIVPPAIEPDVFTVGNVDQNNLLDPASSRGPVTYNGTSYLKPDLVAPGVNILSSIVGDGATYGTETGTSMSAPEVAGGVALLWSAFPEIRGNVAETEQILRSSATPLTAVQDAICPSTNVSSAPNDAYGYGLLNVDLAYQRLLQTYPRVYQYLPVIFR